MEQISRNVKIYQILLLGAKLEVNILRKISHYRGVS